MFIPAVHTAQILLQGLVESPVLGLLRESRLPTQAASGPRDMPVIARRTLDAVGSNSKYLWRFELN